MVQLGKGVVGGYVDDFNVLGVETGDLAQRILEGESAASIPVRKASGGYVVDWRELRRWKLDESLLPRGTEIRFREPSLWSQYAWVIIVVGPPRSPCRHWSSAACSSSVPRRRRAEEGLRRVKSGFEPWQIPRP